LPDAIKFLVEIISVFYLFLCLIVFAINKQLNIGVKYLIYYLILFISIIVSSALNLSSAEAVLFGIRHYFKYLPIFIFPLVYSFDESDVLYFLKIILFLLLIQTPVCIFQRFFLFAGVGTGDVVVGTLASSGVLSVILICSLSMVYGLYLKEKISKLVFYTISFFLFLPTTINETKITFLVLPFALFIPQLLLKGENVFKRIKKIIGYGTAVVLLLTTFVVTYNVIYGGKSNDLLFDYLKREKEGKGYLFLDEERLEEQLKTGDEIGRGDTLILANQYLSKNLKHYVFGIGIGNALPGRMTKFLTTGEEEIQKYYPGQLTITNVFWEIGLVGVFLQIVIFIMCFQDIYSLAKDDDLLSGIALGWCGVISVTIISLVYFNIYHNDEYNMIFWFFTGILLSFKYRKQSVSYSEYYDYNKNVEY
jgi:hypothetical protein